MTLKNLQEIKKEKANANFLTKRGIFEWVCVSGPMGNSW
jgi:hypothetical protein